MEKINKLAIIGGTHGNEFTGIYLVKKFEKFPDLISRTNFETKTLLANPEALKLVRRYVDTDLNRCFQVKDLENNTKTNYEESRAKFINQMLGPKGNPKFDLILDLHTTTANMGLTIILVNNHPFNLKMAAYLSSVEPNVKVYSCFNPGVENSLINSICERGFAIEVGPIAQGVIQADLFQKTEKLVQTSLDFVEYFNEGKLHHINGDIVVYQHLKVVDYPKTEEGEITAMIHPKLEGKDYQKLSPGEPMFLTFDGKTIYYEEENPVWPVFINEAAYYEKGIAMCLTKQESITV
ncbi:aspartoacylase [Hydrocoleum sp. CS-953]|uniref:aspartoacylase n=1 Tax=Hydrocoleum sp. CS-953 TaxID=1671698 RepID=UPI000B9B5C48|nr:aspartoacylase [Hydrocoleum sp. CS-953]OZH55328.1 aspartoacylase [Hydrocoleum sp. CS-953]